MLWKAALHLYSKARFLFPGKQKAEKEVTFAAAILKKKKILQRLLREKPETWDGKTEENENPQCCRERCFAKRWWQHILYWICVALWAPGAAGGCAEIACDAG